MKGENIVCFAKDWNGDPTSVTHVMKLLARDNRVLWINSIATRSPNLARRGDLKKIIWKLSSFLRGPLRIHDNLWVYTPIVLPLPFSQAAIRLNRWILRTSIGLLRRKLKMGSFQLWAWPPTAGEYVDVLGQSLTVYYCTDSWADFSTVDGAKMKGLEDHLCRRADIVFATSSALAAEKSQLNAETHLAAHGVNYEAFARATDEETPLPPDLAALPGAVLGFYGLIEDWLDQDLLLYLAARHPEWSIALVGKVCVDVSRLQDVPNIHFLGRKPHSELPNYCKGFSVGLIPHKVNALTIHMNPIKLREYLSAGLPVVSTALPEIRNYPRHCAVADSYEAFERAVEDSLREDTPEQRKARSLEMQDETWERKVEILGETVLRVSRQTDLNNRTAARPIDQTNPGRPDHFHRMDRKI